MRVENWCHDAKRPQQRLWTYLRTYTNRVALREQCSQAVKLYKIVSTTMNNESAYIIWLGDWKQLVDNIPDSYITRLYLSIYHTCHSWIRVVFSTEYSIRFKYLHHTITATMHIISILLYSLRILRIVGKLQIYTVLNTVLSIRIIIIMKRCRKEALFYV